MLESIILDWSALEMGRPWLLALLPLPLLVWWFMPAHEESRTALRAPFYANLQAISDSSPGSGRFVRDRSVSRLVVLWIGWVLLVLAMVSPRLISEPELVVKEGRDFMVAVDLSGSMQTRDFLSTDQERTSRLEAVRSVFEQFLSRRQGDRVGLIVFGDEAYLDAPLTTDLAGVQAALAETEVGLAGQETSIGNAIGLSLQLFQADSVESRVLLLITDGVDSGSELTPVRAARAAARDSVVIYTIGVGQAGIRGSDLDESTLTEVSSITDGQYFNASDSGSLIRISNELDVLEPVEFEQASSRSPTLLFYWPLGTFLVLVIVQQLFFASRALRKDT
jgi:Ca-activated chloride channel family protein